MGDVTSSSSSSEDAMFPSDKAKAPSESSRAFQPLGAEPSSPPDTHKSQPLDPSGPVEDGGFQRAGTGSSESDTFIPGEGWKTKKANDEYQRAWAMLEDKNFSLSTDHDSIDRTQNRAKLSL